MGSILCSCSHGGDIETSRERSLVSPPTGWNGPVSEEERRELQALKPCQVRALLGIREKCRMLQRIARTELLERVEDLGFSERDMDRTLAYIREQAPVIIHVDLHARAEQLALDTHYRNMFE